jgi:hypothetical protein
MSGDEALLYAIITPFIPLTLRGIVERRAETSRAPTIILKKS